MGGRYNWPLHIFVKLKNKYFWDILYFNTNYFTTYPLLRNNDLLQNIAARIVLLTEVLRPSII